VDALFAKFRELLHIVCRHPTQAASELSGGNQQKIVFGKWLATEPCVLILDEPTNGVDVNAKADMRAAIRAAADHGIGVLLISSELDELSAAADRVLLMVEGRISRVLTDVGTEAELRALLQADIAASRNDTNATTAQRTLESAT
jgi:ABC-type sugar transport system ATPase subunit